MRYSYLIRIPENAKQLLINQLDFAGGTYVKIPVGLVESIVINLQDKPEDINNKHLLDGGTWLYIKFHDDSEQIITPELVE